MFTSDNRVALDLNLNFNTHVNQKIKKCNKTFSKPGNSLCTIYKSFIRPHLNFVHTLLEKSNNEKFQNKMEINGMK